MPKTLADLRIEKELADGLELQNSSLSTSLPADPTKHAQSLLYTLTVAEGLYTGHRYTFSINIPKSYPFSPPKVVCLSPIFHPSIDEAGRVCLNVTREDWSILLGVQHVIFAINHIFHNPHAEDPLNQDAGALLLSDVTLFRQKISSEYNRK